MPLRFPNIQYLTTSQGIPASAEQQPPAPSAQTPAAPALAQATTTTSATPAATADADEPVNLFDIAAAANQGGRTGGAARGAAGGQDALAGMGGEGENLDFLRDNATFQHLRQLVQQQPAMLENVLQQVGASNPQLAQMIASNPQQFLQLLSESDDGEGAPMPPGAQNISVTPEERDAIERVSFVRLRVSDTLLTIWVALPPWFRARLSHPGILCLRQERGAGRKLPLRPP